MIVTCSSCQTKLKVDNSLVGRKIRCTKCHTIIVVGGDGPEESAPDSPRPRKSARADADLDPGPESEESRPPRRRKDLAEDDEEPVRRRRRDLDEDEPPPRRNRDFDEDEPPRRGKRHYDDEEERRPRRARLNEKLAGFLAVGAILALIGGGVLTFLGWQQWTIYKQGQPDPQTIRLADLAAKGPGGNIHVRVTDIDFGMNVVYESKGSRWTRVWIPMFPPGQKGGPVKVLVKTFRVKDQKELDSFCQQQRTITGVITNSIHSLGSAERKELEKGYPGVDFSKVWMIEDGRSFPGGGTVVGMIGGGLGLVVVGLLLGVIWFLFRRR